MGATIEDGTAAGSFQSMVLMVPFVLVIFISAILENSSSTIVKDVSYLSFTFPSVMIFQLTLLENWVWWEIVLSLVILFVSIYICIKIAGKIFKIGIQKYGKNATSGDIWKWIWSS